MNYEVHPLLYLFAQKFKKYDTFYMIQVLVLSFKGEINLNETIKYLPPASTSMNLSPQEMDNSPPTDLQ